MGGGARFPYPKHVWSPAGGWWTNPRAWKYNTAVISAGMLVVLYSVATVSWDKEKRYIMPDRYIPSMSVARQFREDEEAKKVAERFRSSS